MIRVTVLEAKALKSATVETEHLMLSILKNKENIATQILNQFDVDYDLFRQELGIVKSNEPRAEYTDENDDDFDGVGVTICVIIIDIHHSIMITAS